MIRSLFVVLTLLFFIACSSSSQLSSISPDKTNRIELKGTKASSLDPWQIAVIATGPAKSQTFKLEIFQSELDQKTVQFAWNSDSVVIITITDQENIIHHFTIMFNTDDIVLTEN